MITMFIIAIACFFFFGGTYVAGITSTQVASGRVVVSLGQCKREKKDKSNSGMPRVRLKMLHQLIMYEGPLNRTQVRSTEEHVEKRGRLNL